MNLGQAVYKLIAQSSPKREESPGALVKRGLAEAGGVSQLARAIGVSRTTVQRWKKGSTPTGESQELLRAALRRADLSAGRETRIARSNSLTLKGRQGDRSAPRTIRLGPYLAPGTMAKAVEAYLRGASAADLHVVVWSGITDRNYRWLFQPPGGLGQASHATRSQAARDARQGGAGSGGGGGGSGASGGDDDDGDALGELGELGGYDDDEWDDYLDDLAYEGDVVEDLDKDYEFSIGSAS